MPGNAFAGRTCGHREASTARSSAEPKSFRESSVANTLLAGNSLHERIHWSPGHDFAASLVAEMRTCNEESNVMTARRSGKNRNPRSRVEQMWTFSWRAPRRARTRPGGFQVRCHPLQKTRGTGKKCAYEESMKRSKKSNERFE